ncbi:MAG TPA: hypothetical protein DIT64_09080 [Verrucomicrobiales bacterium]|nr:hypothetical protein [Verrucomicrobiales bacterium]
MSKTKPPVLEIEKAPAPSKGVKLARANRAACNDLANDERAALMGRAMNLIYGSNGPKVSAHRR